MVKHTIVALITAGFWYWAVVAELKNDIDYADKQIVENLSEFKKVSEETTMLN